MANINGNEIYFGIIGSVSSGGNSPIGEAVGELAGISSSVIGEALIVTSIGEPPLSQE